MRSVRAVRYVEGCEGIGISYLVEVSAGQAHIRLENKDNREREKMVSLALER